LEIMSKAAALSLRQTRVVSAWPSVAVRMFAALAATFVCWLPLTAIAAVGLKTRPQHLAQLGWRPLLMLVVETPYTASSVGTAGVPHFFGH
jgi:uncharacterized membrane protein YadS